MQQVKECMTVTLEYRIRTTDINGEQVEAPPQTCSFAYGVDVQYPSVETAIMNKCAGDRVKAYLPPEELFGTYDESLVRELPREDYKEERLKPGKMYRQIRKKCLVQFMVKEVRDDVVVADFNDPRAGTTAEFDILIKEVRPATPVELQPACSRG